MTSSMAVLALCNVLSGAAAVASTNGVDLYACYNRCYAIERTRAVDAVKWFCNLYADKPIGSGVTGN